MYVDPTVTLIEWFLNDSFLITAVQHQTFQNKLIRQKVDVISAPDTHYDNNSILTESDLEHKTFSLTLMTFHMLNTCTNFMCYLVLSWYCCCVCCQRDLFAVMLHKPQTKILNHLLSHFSYLSRYKVWKIRMKTNPMMCTVNLMLRLNMDSQKKTWQCGSESHLWWEKCLSYLEACSGMLTQRWRRCVEAFHASSSLYTSQWCSPNRWVGSCRG